MKPRFIHITLTAAVLTLNSSAQITDLGTVAGRFFAINALTTAGTKLIGQSETETRLLNLDLSTYLTITYPAPPVDFEYQSVPYLISESVFDNDASTVEVLLVLTAPVGGIATRVINQDGSILFELMDYGPTGMNAPTDLFSSAAIFNATDGFTYMQLASGPLAVPETKLYRLPGSLPCLDCSGFGMGMTQPNANGNTALQVFPNPASGPINVSCLLPAGVGSAVIEVFSSDGKLARRIPLGSDRAALVDLHGLASGQYTFTAAANGTRVASCAVTWLP